MMAAMILLAALAVLIVPPWLIMALPPRWLALAVPTGILGFYAVMRSVVSDFTVNDPGPAGLLVMSFFGMVSCVNGIALVARLITSL